MGRVINQFCGRRKIYFKSPHVGSGELGEGQNTSVFRKQASELLMYGISA
jgi:hypothetical protein